MAKPTINDVARLAGVSKKTVSRVINQSPLLSEATRAKVAGIIKEIGYVPDPQARALALRRGSEAAAADTSDASSGPIDPSSLPERQLIVLVYDATAAPSLPDVQQGALAAIRGTGFALGVCLLESPASEIEEKFRAFLARQRPGGVLLLPPLSEVRALSGLCREFGCRHACLGAASPDDQDRLVTSDDRAAATQAVAYLISLGHRRIGMITGPEDSRVSQERELGYLDAMADHDLDRGPALIATGDHSFQSGLAAGQLLLEVSPCPTAIFAGNDEMAAGVLHAAAQKRINVPEDLSIIGFEDTAIAARLCPQLTTVRVPLAEMASAAALSIVNPEGAKDRPLRFAAELVARGSTGPAPD